MKTLLLHVPKFNNFYKPIGDFIWLNYMPMGFLAIGDYLDRNSLPVEIVHLGVEWVENRNFDVSELISNQSEIKAIGIPIHWHHQAYDAIEVANASKRFAVTYLYFPAEIPLPFFMKKSSMIFI